MICGTFSCVDDVVVSLFAPHRHAAPIDELSFSSSEFLLEMLSSLFAKVISSLFSLSIAFEMIYYNGEDQEVRFFN